MHEWIQLIRDVGFPIAITGYLLIRMERTIKELNDKLIQLETYIKAKLGGDN